MVARFFATSRDDEENGNKCKRDRRREPLKLPRRQPRHGETATDRKSNVDVLYYKYLGNKIIQVLLVDQQ